MQILFVYLWFACITIYTCQRLADQNIYVGVGEPLNICDLENSPGLNVHCYCDNTEFQNASRAKCWIFNDGEKESSLIWDEYRSQSKLNSLKFNVRSKPSLNFIPTRALARLPELVDFTLIYANITTVVPYAFANSTTLQKLELKQNEIESLEKHAIANLTTLQEVCLGQNNIREIGRDTFKNLPSLKRLYLEENAIETVHDLAFADLKSLQELDMFKNQLTVVSRNTFVGLTSLKRLDLHSNLLSELNDFTFAEMTELRELIVEQNMIENIGEHVFYGIQNLDKLVLAENKLHILPDDVFANLPHLRVLDLRDNLLQSITFDTALPILDRLKTESFHFYIEGNRLECDCNLLWLRTLANETINEPLRMKLKQLSCYMKGNYYARGNGGGDLEMNTNGLPDSRTLRTDVLSDGNQYRNKGTDAEGNGGGSSSSSSGIPDNVDRMLKLFNIPHETLPCSPKRRANEVLMEQTFKEGKGIGAATSLVVTLYNFGITTASCILITTNASIL